MSNQKGVSLHLTRPTAIQMFSAENKILIESMNTVKIPNDGINDNYRCRTDTLPLYACL